MLKSRPVVISSRKREMYYAQEETVSIGKTRLKAKRLENGALARGKLANMLVKY